MIVLQATTSLFFLSIAYTDALSLLAMILLEYALLLMLLMFIHLANVKGRQVCAISQACKLESSSHRKLQSSVFLPSCFPLTT